jgi:formyltetrahydrofolate-dependent phosphoribosylglycinamide formyltransferase|tara:strand:+ start:197 stop:778 length:582 start_codon:yes stop_codon:yes gene_type:complete
MNQSPGNNKISTAIFISGRGSNLKSLVNFSKKKTSPIHINLIISNTKKAKGLKYADLNKIQKKIINFKKKNSAEKNILNMLNKKKINFICLAGFMKVLSKKFISKFPGKIINIHPSLLPKYKGLNTHLRVLQNNEKFSGCTVHHVNKHIDAGEIIMQKKIKISKNETVNSLSKKILMEEHKLYPKAISKVFLV